MVVSGRLLLLALLVVIAAASVVIWVDERAAQWLALVIAGCALVALLLMNMFRPPIRTRGREPADMRELSDARRRELVRGTSLFLRDTRYRFSIRQDPSDREPFSAVINEIPLGFVPVIITENATDRQGYGYVAFVYDGDRWRGPGLPCIGGPQEAVEHAQKCVMPLDSEDAEAVS